ncbi:hypothetical protein THMIRHAS_15790 [Thiosulfatimonas sediminis]|uniref:DUF3581 domain-containing protein n=1 Tax=Thiosulfatimonas sediminis TaxID=2675054 RepID=A0A6F8PVT1_9GAMM|nr:DUF3581 domain-containing protein [Thiosulfatimonas sediminis]BBP46206.1 hypothetical protein THMIRHAS_15790 [Thiosulfatimonas sediminis]
MFLDHFYQTTGERIQISAEQGSRFAKEVANDFNPLHNPDSKRFCVPGDLLFSLVLKKYGLSQNMTFKYTGMVGNNLPLELPLTDAEKLVITDEKGKDYLHVERAGAISDDAQLIENFARSYVAFSGISFPHILVPLMQQNKVMINPSRPMVIYDNMSFELHDLNLRNPQLKLTDSTLDVDGKRGLIKLHFAIFENDIEVGKGSKNMTIGGLREYDEAEMQQLIQIYEKSKQAYQQQVA